MLEDTFTNKYYRICQKPYAHLLVAFVFSRSKPIVGLDNLFLSLPNPRPSKSTFHQLVKFLVAENFLQIQYDSAKKSRKIIGIHPMILDKRDFFRLPETKK